MSRILITSGPTRQYLDPVRYLTNESSGRMGCALALAAIEQSHQVVIVSGPVDVKYPRQAEIIWVISTEEMLAACRKHFPHCDGMIGAAAPCDYRPAKVQSNKITKTGDSLDLHLVETPDVVATLGAEKDRQWMVGFALETENHQLNALTKMRRKNCDLMMLNEPAAMNSLENKVTILNRKEEVIATPAGSKEAVAREIIAVIEQTLIGTTL